MAVAGDAPRAVMQLETDGIAKLDREAQAIVVECSAPVDRIGVEDRNLEFPAEVSLQNLSYAPGNLALQYCYWNQLLAFGALVVSAHHLSPRIAWAEHPESVHQSLVVDLYIRNPQSSILLCFS